MTQTRGADQFGELGDAYDESEEALTLRRRVEQPSVLALLGDLTGRSVLDVGCGSGVYTRLVRRRGADPVTGIDLAAGMIAAARATEAAHPLGIAYEQADVSDAGSVGRFDIVLGVYVLPYATSVEHLEAMCAGMAAATAPGGRVVTLPLNPDFSADPGWYAEYGFTLRELEPRGEGSRIELHATFGTVDFRVEARRWSTELIDSLFDRLGFVTRWSRMTAPAADPAAAEDFRTYLEVPHALLLECRRR